jgi:hypothetical protein
MLNNRIVRSIAVALAIAAAAAPAASARPVDTKEYTLPHDFQAADTSREAVIQRGIYEPMSPDQQPQPPQDLRNIDTRDYAEGRGTYNAPEVVVVEAPQPAAPQPTSGGIDWQDVGLGAGSLLAIALMGAGGALFVVHRRGARGLAT